MNGSVPVNVSYSMTPTEYRSLRASAVLPRNRSGGKYAIVPTISPALVALDMSLVRRASPKSITFTAPLGSTITLAGLTSRCTTSFSCAYDSASSTSM